MGCQLNGDAELSPPRHKNATEMPQNVPIFARFCVWLPTLGNARERLVFQMYDAISEWLGSRDSNPDSMIQSQVFM